MRHLPANFVYPGYVFPFSEYTPSRVDQGKDFTGKGAIKAIGKARILRLGAPGWPEGGGVLYQLLDGPMSGRNVFVYEGVNPRKDLRPGMVVGAGEPIATFRPGGSIEIGFADSAGVPLSHSEYIANGNGWETRYGKAFQQFLGHIYNPPASHTSDYSSPSLLGELGHDVTHPASAAKDALGIAGGAAGNLAGDVVGGIFDMLHPEALMVNIALLGGGAFLVYYGAALMAGVKSPVLTPLKAVPK